MTYGHERIAPVDWRILDADRRFALVQQMLNRRTASSRRPAE